MTTTVRDAGPFEKLVTVHIPNEELDAAMNRTARRLSSEVKIKGFRPGKAPRPIVEATVGTDRLRSEALEDALPELVADALSQSDLRPAVNPSLEKLEDVDDGVEIEVKVTLWPTLDRVPSYRDREIQVEAPEVSEQELSTQIDRMRSQFAELAVVPRAARDDDFASINISATHDGEPVPEAAASDLLYEIGSVSFIEGLDDELVGKAAGEIFKYRASLPDGFGDLAGERVTIQVLVKDVRERRLPDLTDEWVEDVTEFETVEELKGELTTQLESFKRAAAADQFRRNALDQLLAEMDVVVPEAIVGAEMDATLHRFALQLAGQDIELADYLEVTGQTQEAFLDDLRSQAERNARTDILLDAVAQKEELEVTDEEFEAAARAIAAQAEESPDGFVKELRGTSREIALRSDILKRKALQAVLDAAVPIDQNGSPIDLRSVDEGSTEREPAEESE
ncbi:MAG: trigger factor [Acidimicrobiia bacterium]